MLSNLIEAEPITQETLTARGRDALNRMRPKMAALTTSQIRPLNFDLGTAISRALAVAPAIRSLRDQVTRDCPSADQAVIDELEDRAFAAACANADYETAIAPPDGLDAAYNEALEARSVLMAGANFLVTCNVFKPAQVAGVDGGRGYQEVAQDALTLVSLYTQNWERLEGKLPIPREKIDRVQAVAERLMLLLGYLRLSNIFQQGMADGRS